MNKYKILRVTQLQNYRGLLFFDVKAGVAFTSFLSLCCNNIITNNLFDEPLRLLFKDLNYLREYIATSILYKMDPTQTWTFRKSIPVPGP